MTNPFTLFGLAPSFDLDVDQIEARWRELSKAVHPDKHAAGTAADRRHALAKAMDLNAAFRVLKDPIRRAEAVVAAVVPESAAVAGGNEPPAPMELLMQMMQLRGDLANARAARDAAAVAASVEEVRGLDAACRERTSQTLAALARDPATDPTEARQEIGKLRYYRRFLEEAEAILDDLADGTRET